MRSGPLRVFCLGLVRRLAFFRGGGGPVPFPPWLALGRVPPCGRSCASGAVRRRGGGGAACVPPPQGAWQGGPEGRGVALPWSVPSPSLGRHPKGCHRRRSVHGGRGLHTAPVRVRVSTPGVIRGAPLCAGAGPPACRGHYGSRRVAAWGRVAYGPSGVPPPPPPGAAALLGGGGGGGGSYGLGGVEGRRPLGPPSVSRGPEMGEWGVEGGGGGAVVPRHPLPVPRPRPSTAAGGMSCSSWPRPPLMAGAVAPRVPPCRLLGWGCLAAPGAGRGMAGCRWVSLVRGGGGCAAPCRGLGRGAPGGGGRGVALPLSDLCPPLAGIKAGRSGVALPPTLHRLASACRRPDAVRGVPLRASVGLLACRGYCASGRAADWGRAAYGPSGAPPCCGPLGGGGGLFPWPSRGGCGAAVPLAGLRLSVG